MSESDRRDFLKKTAYVAPAIITLKAVPAFAGSGSGYGGGNNQGDNNQGDNNQGGNNQGGNNQGG